MTLCSTPVSWQKTRCSTSGCQVSGFFHFIHFFQSLKGEGGEKGFLVVGFLVFLLWEIKQDITAVLWTYCRSSAHGKKKKKAKTFSLLAFEKVCWLMATGRSHASHEPQVFGFYLLFPDDMKWIHCTWKMLNLFYTFYIYFAVWNFKATALL